jgi:hypothetical protein
MALADITLRVAHQVLDRGDRLLVPGDATHQRHPIAPLHSPSCRRSWVQCSKSRASGEVPRSRLCRQASDIYVKAMNVVKQR